MKKVLLSLGVVAALAMTSCGGGPSVCECVNMDEEKADEAMVKECETMEKEWKDKYKEASDEDKEEMMKEIEACEKEGGEEEEAH